ncbi:uncharacterized protein [Nicotiana sylvestris]|uniref:uncharacterized protein n=1 Tax=Nicotiana sylvestris TaxID=4096 RepID=UPI00388C9342
MTGIPPEVMTHKLNEDPSYPPVKQKKRKQGTFKNQDHFEWIEECQQALRNLKLYLSNPPLLAKPKAGEKLLLYLAISEVAVSVGLVREEHGRLAKWAIELSEYEIAYQPRTAIKSQVLVDFVANFSQGIQLEAEKKLQVFTGANPGTWTLFTDGSSNVRGACLGIVLVPPTGETIRQAIKCHSITNNEAEYEGMIADLELARELGINQIIIKSDSQLVVNQMLGTYTAREAWMQQYLEKVWELVKQFEDWKIRQIPRDENREADALANLPSAADVENDTNASVIHLFHSVLDPHTNEVNFNNLTWDWRNEIVVFLQYGTVPDDKKKAYALRRQATRYCLKQGNLYRKMFGGPLARCLGPSQTEYVMREIHEGHWGNHAGGRSLVRTLIRAGYYWPKMEEEAEHFIAKWDKCQRYDNNMHRHVELLHPVISLWPFMKWGMNIVGPLLQAKGRITSTPYHPVGNGQAESTNKVIINNLKKRLEESKGNWPEVLPGVLWAYRTTAKTSTGETPFSLVYGAEALIPVEIGEPSTGFTQATQESNEEEMRVNLDLLEGRREVALIRMAAQKQVIE